LDTTYQAKDKNITGKAYGNITNREYNTNKKSNNNIRSRNMIMKSNKGAMGEELKYAQMTR